MGKETKVFKSSEESSISRRSFLKGLAAMSALGAVAGCSKDNGGEIIYGSTGGGLEGAVDPEDLSDLSSFDLAYATCPHNCGPGIRCVSKIWTKNGRIVRVTTDETKTDINGNVRDKNNWNDPRQLNCAKGHSYRYRVYHSGRLKYPLKQTKKRGDATGFVRISWQQAYNEVIRKHRAVYAKYGPAAIQAGNNNSSSGYWAAASRAVSPITSLGSTRGSFSDHSFHQYNYCYNMAGVPNSRSYSRNHIGSQIPAVAGGAIKNWVSFGTNSMSTNNTLSYPYLRANQLAKELNPNFKHYVISPELTDTGVLNATDWVQIRNMTDSALIAGMIYHLITKTFNPDGSIIEGGLLDVDYIDTCVYGFFDSPAYWINESTGEISLTEQSGWTKINEVPAGRSYAAWIMGNDDRLTKAKYSASNNYTAKAYSSVDKDKPRASLCSMTIGGETPAYQADINTTKYYTKKDYMTPKSPEWAEKITGTPADVIRELAELYAKPENHPILTEWTGGLQKSENGVLTLFAIQTLFAITKTWGYSHGSTGGMYQSWASNPGQLGTAPNVESLPSIPSSGRVTISNGSGSGNPSTPSISCKEHFNGLYFAFKEELDNNPDFKGFANPFWDGSTRYLNDDAGAKTQILYKREDDGKTYKTYVSEDDGRTYYDYVGREEGKPVYVGKRFYIGSAGTQLNQVANTNWAAEIMKALPLAGNNPDDPDTFCMAVFDVYMSPQAMLADYVFPMANTLEVVDNASVGGLKFRRLPLSTPPGEAKDAWDAAFIGWNEQSKLGNYNASRLDCAVPYGKTVPADAGYTYINSTAPTYKSVNDLYRADIEEVCKTSTSRFYGMTVNQAIAAQILPKTASDPVNVTETTMSDLRKAVDSYLQTDMSAPFIYAAKANKFTPSVSNDMNSYSIWDNDTTITYDGLTEETRKGIPNNCGRMTCYAEYAVYTWEHAYDKFHGWLKKDQRGQRNKDYENDPFIYPIPMYYAFEDTFNEMYGVFNTSGHDVQGGWYTVGPKPSSNDISKITDKLTLTVGSTHDRYRSHSSQAENPYLRELTHRTKGGGWASCNDWNEYCVVPEIQAPGSKGDFSPMISRAVANKDMTQASWHEFWMNDEDAAQFGIMDGDLLRVSNPVGAIRVIARVTKRIVRGHGQIHQGAWYDPNPVDKVDDGACANTIMSNRPSRFDNGNSVHCAYCIVEKETSF
ncbi:MAG TPA: molybdopterin-dependent oxidoreductase [Candidatus Mucispirillum faecigallinarum]|uniref:Molybdopterin-dependent oxidoreductase n=1 Tax=Candidatus Mucispirillum faecigallinarum TaxID=2838699 RepID=A0A9D2GUQ6_9BACT|nr:molybdopterin-dependent oxidoreductase [Candidatus Mucispirillum faecigallinarum]